MLMQATLVRLSVPHIQHTRNRCLVWAGSLIGVGGRQEKAIGVNIIKLHTPIKLLTNKLTKKRKVTYNRKT